MMPSTRAREKPLARYCSPICWNSPFFWETMGARSINLEADGHFMTSSTMSWMVRFWTWLWQMGQWGTPMRAKRRRR